jgi:signal transduction histidine kinase/CheY-like chemotaxis protein
MEYVYIMVISLVYASVLNLVFFKKNHIKTRETYYYSLLLVVNLIGLLLEIFCTFVGNVFPVASPIPSFFTKIYMCFLTLFIYYICIYIYSICLDDNAKKFNLIKKIFTGLLILSILVTFYLPIITSKGYATGPAVNFVYTIGIIYMSLASLGVIINYKKINFKKVIPFFLFITFSGIVSLIQKYNPRITLTTSIECLVIFVMYFTIENPDLKIIEELSKAKTLSEKSTNEKSNFLHIVTNDIDNKIHLIENKCDNILKEKPKSSIKEDILDIKNILDLAKIKIKQTIDVSEMDSKNLKNVNSTYDIMLLLNSIYLNTKNKVNPDVKYNLDINGELPKELYGDSIKLKQMIMTILNNSIKYTKSGYIEFRVNSIIKNDVCRLIVSIEDSGSGMDITLLNDILNNHDDLTKEDLDVLNNSDLNLKIVKKIVNLIGGSFLINSNNTGGLTVTITIDQKIVEIEKSELETKIDKYSNTLKNQLAAAIISSSNDDIKIIKKALKKSGFTTCDYNITKDCLDELRNNKKYDVIFILEGMEKINALSFLNKVNDIKNFTGKVIVMTKTKDLQKRKDLLNQGFSGVITTPINKKELITSIENI